LPFLVGPRIAFLRARRKSVKNNALALTLGFFGIIAGIAFIGHDGTKVAEQQVPQFVKRLDEIDRSFKKGVAQMKRQWDQAPVEEIVPQVDYRQEIDTRVSQKEPYFKGLLEGDLSLDLYSFSNTSKKFYQRVGRTFNPQTVRGLLSTDGEGRIQTLEVTIPGASELEVTRLEMTKSDAFSYEDAEGNRGTGKVYKNESAKTYTITFMGGNLEHTRLMFRYEDLDAIAENAELSEAEENKQAALRTAFTSNAATIKLSQDRREEEVSEREEVDPSEYDSLPVIDSKRAQLAESSYDEDQEEAERARMEQVRKEWEERKARNEENGEAEELAEGDEQAEVETYGSEMNTAFNLSADNEESERGLASEEDEV